MRGDTRAETVAVLDCVLFSLRLRPYVIRSELRFFKSVRIHLYACLESLKFCQNRHFAGEDLEDMDAFDRRDLDVCSSILKVLSSE